MGWAKHPPHKTLHKATSAVAGTAHLHFFFVVFDSVPIANPIAFLIASAVHHW